MKRVIFLFGVDDPEMRVIEQIARKSTFACFAYATAGGSRVHPGNAYKADPISGLKAGDTLVRIECEPTSVPEGVKVVVVDHHRLGDPGYGKGPADFWSASSIGQLVELLDSDVLAITPAHCNVRFIFNGYADEKGWARIQREWRALAAMDHCFPAAVRGECPGVSPEAVLAVKCREIAAGAKTDEAVVAARVEFFRRELAGSPEEAIGEQGVRDLRRHDLGAGYSLDLLAAQVAATIGGHAALLRHRDRDDQPEKWTLSGNTAPETVAAFKDAWAPAHGLVRIYGVPDRGYAGGYTA